ncbi:ParA family protein [Candidatus Frankia alpina]|uniref:ParA family protein n=1 Tax=Candidatus Frankia alpina TaxID=2699483 RepID=A0A4V3Z7N2_9ACTN|nr:ParA family protein [Candidatus Frankia alpina]
MRILIFASQKGGVGKTTLALNITHLLAETLAARVLLLDTDSNGDSARWADRARGRRPAPFRLHRRNRPSASGTRPRGSRVRRDRRGHAGRSGVRRTACRGASRGRGHPSESTRGAGPCGTRENGPGCGSAVRSAVPGSPHEGGPPVDPPGGAGPDGFGGTGVRRVQHDHPELRGARRCRTGRSAHRGLSRPVRQ